MLRLQNDLFGGHIVSEPKIVFQFVQVVSSTLDCIQTVDSLINPGQWMLYESEFFFSSLLEILELNLSIDAFAWGELEDVRKLFGTRPFATEIEELRQSGVIQIEPDQVGVV